MSNASIVQAKSELLKLLKLKSFFRGDFTLASGAKSNYYIDCRLTTLDAQGAWLVGQVMLPLIRQMEQTTNKSVKSIGGLTMGADPVALATAIASYQADSQNPIHTFVVRKSPKAHGQTKLIEGNFQPGDTVAVLDDVITTGESTLKAIDAVVQAGGKIAFAAVLVDRQEGGRQNIEAKGYPVVAAFTRDELMAG
jgi:orotate phosphoribosyltransferase